MTAMMPMKRKLEPMEAMADDDHGDDAGEEAGGKGLIADDGHEADAEETGGGEGNGT
jgi:hypothetical protein